MDYVLFDSSFLEQTHIYFFLDLIKSETALCEARPFKALKFQKATIVIENIELGEGEWWKASTS